MEDEIKINKKRIKEYCWRIGVVLIICIILYCMIFTAGSYIQGELVDRKNRVIGNYLNSIANKGVLTIINDTDTMLIVVNLFTNEEFDELQSKQANVEQ